MGGGGVSVGYVREQTRSGGGTYVKVTGVKGIEATTDNNYLKSHLKCDNYPLSLPRRLWGGGG